MHLLLCLSPVSERLSSLLQARPVAISGRKCSDEDLEYCARMDVALPLPKQMVVLQALQSTLCCNGANKPVSSLTAGALADPNGLTLLSHVSVQHNLNGHAFESSLLTDLSRCVLRACTV